MRCADRLNLLLVGCLAVGCATTSGHGSAGGGPDRSLRTAEEEVLVAPPLPSPEAIAAYNEATSAREAGDYATALNLLTQALQLDPNYFDALNDKAWILAAHPNPQVRDPKQALELALRASTNLGKWGLLREERDALPAETSTARHMMIMGTIAGALASDGRFLSEPQTYPEGSAALAEQNALTGSMNLSASSDGGSALAAMGFVMDLARWLNGHFPDVPETGQALERTQSLMNMYQQGQAPIGQEPVLWGNTTLTRLR
jgi:tetratricopeptide (TPR) repeat protein